MFDDLPDFALTAACGAAADQIDADAFGSAAGEAEALLAAHYAELGKPGRAGGTTIATAGNVSVTYGSGPLEYGGVMTSFLALFLGLARRRVLPAFVCTGDG